MEGQAEHETLPTPSHLCPLPSHCLKVSLAEPQHQSTMSDLRRRIESTTRAFISAFEEGSSQQDASIINRDVTPDCTRHMHPASVPQAFGLPEDFVFDAATFQAAFAKDIKVLRFEGSVISNLVIDAGARSAAFTSVAKVIPNNGEAYNVEQAWFLYFNEDGSKVKKVVEFCNKDAILRMASASA